MSDTGWVSPGTVMNDNSSGDIDWTSAGNAKVSDGNYASTSSSSLYDPPRDYLVKLVNENGALVGENKAADSILDSSDTYRVYGGSSDDWGETWSTPIVNSESFGLIFQVIFRSFVGDEISRYLRAYDFDLNVPTGSTIDGVEARVEQKYWVDTEGDLGKFVGVDHIQIKVYYTEGSTPAVGTKYHLPPFKRS